MARAIKVDAEQLRGWATDIRGIAQEYQTNYRSLLSVVDGLSGSWTGEDNVAYQKKVHEFDDDFQKMTKELLQYASYLEKTAKVYDVVRNVAQKKAGNLKAHYNESGKTGGNGSTGGSISGGGSSGGGGSSRSF